MCDRLSNIRTSATHEPPSLPRSRTASEARLPARAGFVNRWALLALAIVTEVSATLSLRAATETPAWYGVVAVGYVASFLLLAGVLRAGMSIGVAYGIWAAVGVSATALLAAGLFGEPLTPVMGIGFLTVIAGVLLVELGSHRVDSATALHGDRR